jgi:hypothetical protein
MQTGPAQRANEGKLEAVLQNLCLSHVILKESFFGLAQCSKRKKIPTE